MKHLLITIVILSAPAFADNDRRNEASKYFKNREYSKAAEIYEDLAAAGDADAEYTIALLYKSGVHYEQDVEKAIGIFKSLCEKYVEPCTSLGETYVILGEYDQAEIAYLKAANSGDLWAYGNLGTLFYNKKWDKFDEEEAKRWFQILENADRDAYDQRVTLTRHKTSNFPSGRSQ
jgi:TPR repeat protein